MGRQCDIIIRCNLIGTFESDFLKDLLMVYGLFLRVRVAHTNTGGTTDTPKEYHIILF